MKEKECYWRGMEINIKQIGRRMISTELGNMYLRIVQSMKEIEMGYVDGRIYNGEWKNDKREEIGILKLKTGDTLEGSWTKNILQPLVKIAYSNGDRYEGEITPAPPQRLPEIWKASSHLEG